MTVDLKSNVTFVNVFFMIYQLFVYRWWDGFVKIPFLVHTNAGLKPLKVQINRNSTYRKLDPSQFIKVGRKSLSLNEPFRHSAAATFFEAFFAILHAPHLRPGPWAIGFGVSPVRQKRPPIYSWCRHPVMKCVRKVAIMKTYMSPNWPPAMSRHFPLRRTLTKWAKKGSFCLHS